MPDESFVSFVVIAYNEAPNIARTLAAIAALQGLGAYELLVVNDGSRDDTAQIVSDIAAQDPRIVLIDLPVNRGRGYARSRGVEAARGELVATVDADIILPTDWLTRTRAALLEHDAVGGTAVPDGDVAYLRKRLGLIPRLVGNTTAVTGSNALYHRRVFDVVSFDPSLREGEDSALNHAMKYHRLSYATVPNLLVCHEGNKGWATSLRWLFDVGRGATRQLVTYQEIRQPDLVSGGFVVASAVGLCLAGRRRRLLGVLVPASFVLAASIGHVRSRFEIPRSDFPKELSAVAIDSTMLTAYFAGRLVGLTELWRLASPGRVQLATRASSSPSEAAARERDRKTG